MLDFETCNAARLRRDLSFDGKFFTAVRTTKIYCRPVCPAKRSLTKNVSYYPTAAAAERAGYRPCLRCRPETAPFCTAWNGTKTTVERALRLIEEGALDVGNVNDLADRLSVAKTLADTKPLKTVRHSTQIEPNICLLLIRKIYPCPSRHNIAPSLTQMLKCCDDPLNPHPQSRH